MSLSHAQWMEELTAAQKAVEKWHQRADKVLRAYLDERDTESADEKRWNLFHSNVQTLQSMLYGQEPKVTASRNFADAMDDVARVAGVILERHLNLDLRSGDDTYAEALQSALEDRLLVGLAICRARYEVETEEVPGQPAMMGPDGKELAPEVAPSEKMSSERVDTDYVHWRDFLWSAGARTWDEVRWVGFRAEMPREKVVARFGEKVAKAVPLVAKGDSNRDSTDGQTDDPRDRAEIWEVWDKESREVVWLCKGYPSILDTKADPLGLTGFFPCPKPMTANTTTSRFMPVPDYAMAQDLYVSINEKTTRIGMLESALRAAGVYDSSAGELKQLLESGRGNTLIPVSNWGGFAERGGLRGSIDWMPLDQIAAALGALREARREDMDALFQVTGQSDIMRGQATQAGASATEQRAKSQFGSVRVQRLQDDFAKFASDLQSIKAEIIERHFQPETIFARSNIERTADAQFAGPAVELIKSGKAGLRIEVKPEAVALSDFSALKSESMEVLQTLAAFLSSAGPLMVQQPAAAPYLLQLLQWALARLRGASAIEGVLDAAIAAAEQAAKAPQQGQQQPDPKLLVQQMKGAQDLAKIEAELKADLTRTQAETQAAEATERNQMRWNVAEQAAKTQIMQAARAAMPPKPKGFP